MKYMPAIYFIIFMLIIRKKSELSNYICGYKKEGKTIGFVPTMGALHDGHLSLVSIAKKQSDIVVVSIFVNPAQFAPHEDFDKYPRQEEVDLKKLDNSGVDIVYLPSKEEVYPEGFSTKISVGDVGKTLEGVTRPHFFDGVALVVTKLFNQVSPDIAVFGEKDYQQLSIIRKLVADFNMNIQIIGAPIIRENNGLAMSSRNSYLSEAQKNSASALYRSMQYIRSEIIKGNDVKAAITVAENDLIKAGFDKVDYIAVRDKNSLLEPALNSDLVILAAAYIGGVRLIDNLLV